MLCSMRWMRWWATRSSRCCASYAPATPSVPASSPRRSSCVACATCRTIASSRAPKRRRSPAAAPSTSRPSRCAWATSTRKRRSGCCPEHTAETGQVFTPEALDLVWQLHQRPTLAGQRTGLRDHVAKQGRPRPDTAHHRRDDPGSQGEPDPAPGDPPGPAGRQAARAARPPRRGADAYAATSSKAIATETTSSMRWTWVSLPAHQRVNSDRQPHLPEVIPRELTVITQLNLESQQEPCLVHSPRRTAGHAQAVGGLSAVLPRELGGMAGGLQLSGSGSPVADAGLSAAHHQRRWTRGSRIRPGAAAHRPVGGVEPSCRCAARGDRAEAAARLTGVNPARGTRPDLGVHRSLRCRGGAPGHLRSQAGQVLGRAALASRWKATGACPSPCGGCDGHDPSTAAGRRPARLPPAGEAERGHLQHRLHLLLLPVQGGAVSERKEPDVGGHARGLHPPVAGVASHAAGDGGLAGRRADADEARVLQAGRRTRRKVPPSRPDRAAHLPDQRPAARRRLVRSSSRNTTFWSA